MQLQSRKSRRCHPRKTRRKEGSRRQVLRVRQQGTFSPTQRYKFPHLLVAGIARNLIAPKRSFNKKKFIKKTGVKSFVKYVNQNHVMPTRFIVGDFDLKDISDDNLKTSDARKELRKKVRDRFTEVYRKMPNPKENEKAGHTKFFYTRLRF